MITAERADKRLVHKLAKLDVGDYMTRPFDLDLLKRNIINWAKAIEARQFERTELIILDYDQQKITALLEIFKKEGYNIHKIEDRPAASDTVKGPFDLLFIRADIITDDAIGVLAKYKERYPELPVMITAAPLANKDDLISKARRFGSCGYLPASFNTYNIISVVYGILTRTNKKIKAKEEKKLSDRVFVIDDEPLLCRLISEFLGKEGYDVYSITDARNVLGEVKALKPYIVFMDIVMPRVGGLELLRMIKKIDPGIYVIMMTGVKDDDVCREAIESGASDYLVKPFSLDQIRATALTYSIKSRQDKCTKRQA